MRRAIGLELRKMRRLRVVTLTTLFVVVIAALSSASLFTASTRASFEDPMANPWASLLFNAVFMSAMTSPLFVAVLASRQVEIEHAGGGWNLAGTAGFSPGRLCRAKLLALTIVIAPAVTVQTLLIMSAGALAGIDSPLDPLPWFGYALCLILLDLAFCAAHLWLSTVVENQLVSIGIGTLGSFIGVFALLMPDWLARLVPWGYYAMISPVSTVDDVIAFVAPEIVWVAGFLLLASAAFVLATRRLDRLER
ncbi:ABC transporter permease [Plantibacter cousiniae (nom. nud.)]|uniref:ABC-2 type transport system permease protein n=1 Tax=Plantibacter cousiniae (nom. nud.) TaxID=199709 RepID=A0ABY1LQ21_9MICO|nr:ABC transporter permease [Plantibacter cousiniae]SKC70751.1 hypothetical protein SAMN06295973_3230 [Plantibacter cousiniae]